MGSNPYDVVRQFEAAVADFCGAPYGVAVESCTAALFLACKYDRVDKLKEVFVPKHTYPSVPCSVIHAGGRVKFVNLDWQEIGYYCLHPTRVIDAAKLFARGMYVKKSLMCLSFHGRKPLHIGRGGMILTDSKKAVQWLKLARFDGRHEVSMLDDHFGMVGYNMYLSAPQAALGLERLQWMPDCTRIAAERYPDLSVYSMYKEANR